MLRFITRLFFIWVLFGLSVVNAADKAAPKAPASPWDGSKASLGVNITTGITSTNTSNGELNLSYAIKRWKDALQLTGQYGKTDATLSKEQYFIQNQLSYSFNNIKNIDNYVYVQGSYLSDKFAAVQSQSTVSVGYGRDWYKTDDFQFTTQLGPAYRRSAPGEGNVTRSGWAGKISSLIKWKVFSTVELSEAVDYTFGSPANYVKSVAALTNKITGNLAISLTYTVENWSMFRDGFSQPAVDTNTSTAVNLVYAF